MAVIDTFLNLLTAQRAECLVLVPEEVPNLRKQDETIPLPMPAVPTALSRRLAAEVHGSTLPESSGGNARLEGIYHNADGEEFLYELHFEGDGCRIVMTAPAAASEESGQGPATTRDSESASTPRPPANIPASSPAGPPSPAELPPSGPPTSGNPDSAVLTVLARAVGAGASDVFLSSGRVAQMRLHGILEPIDGDRLLDDQIRALLPSGQHAQDLEGTGSSDFAAQWPLPGGDQRFRVNVFRHSSGLAAALRIIRSRIPSLEELHLPDDLIRLATFASGLVLVTGASGSGKSTTLAALVSHLNHTRARHIITIEDPIEFEHRSDCALVHQREVGSSVESFSTGLRAALRENPDVILLGEMRDLATISAALTAAETGHLVLSTLHTGSATSAINRIVDVFPGHQQAHVRTQLAASLRAVISQRLVPARDGRSRFPALEQLIVTPAVANQIRDGHEHHMRSAMQTGVEEGMMTLERSLAGLVKAGRITRETAQRYALDPLALQKLLP